MRNLRTLTCCAILLLLTAVPATSYAADWNFSPYAAQVSDGTAGQADEEPMAVSEMSQSKSIGKGIMFSLIIPGAGQLYGGSWWRAIPWFAIEVAGWALFSKYHGDGEDKTDEYESYAGSKDNPNNFYYTAYMLAEYQVAANEGFSQGATPYGGNLEDWMDMSWDDRAEYLPAPFTHDINTDDPQQYYEMIGKYYSQFGFGWSDAFDHNLFDPSNPQDVGFIWAVRNDNPASALYDGDRGGLFFLYRDMRGEANDLLDKGNVMMEIVLVNHVLSALDAALTVRGFNKRAGFAALENTKLQYEARNIDGSLARFVKLSYFLN